MQHELILRGARIIDPSQNHDGIADVAFANGLVSGFGRDLPAGEGTEVREMKGAMSRKKEKALALAVARHGDFPT